MVYDPQYIDQLLSAGNELLVTDIANIFSCQLEIVIEQFKKLITARNNEIDSYYIVNYIEDGNYHCKKVKQDALKDYQSASPALYSIKLLNSTKTGFNNEIFNKMMQLFADAKLSGTVYVPKTCVITNNHLALRDLTFLGCEVRANTKSGTTFDSPLKPSQPKLSRSTFKSDSTQKYVTPKLKKETIESISASLTFGTPHEPTSSFKTAAFPVKPEPTLKTFSKRVVSDSDTEKTPKPVIKPKAKPSKTAQYESVTKMNLFEESEVIRQSETYMDKSARIDEEESVITKKIIINKKVPKENTYVDNGYFVMEDAEEIVQEEKEVVIPASSNTPVTQPLYTIPKKKKTQSSITSFFNVIKK